MYSFHVQLSSPHVIFCLFLFKCDVELDMLYVVYITLVVVSLIIVSLFDASVCIRVRVNGKTLI
jgi:hypothetical protein